MIRFTLAVLWLFLLYHESSGQSTDVFGPCIPDKGNCGYGVRKKVLKPWITQRCCDNVCRDGRLGPWGRWDRTCDQRHGCVTRRRYRHCHTSKKCQTCPGSIRDVNTCCVGTWSAWGSWSRCSKYCGIGVQSRQRKCTSRGSKCYGSSIQARSCCRSCYVNGGHYRSASRPTGKNGIQFLSRRCPKL